MVMQVHSGVRHGTALEFEGVLHAARRGEPDAFRVLYDELAGPVCGYLRVHGVADAEDLTNEVFLRVFRGVHDFTGDEAHFRSWVFTITHRIAIDEQRRSRVRVQTSELAPQTVDRRAGGDTEQEAVNRLQSDWVDSVLMQLSADQRSVIALRVISDLTVEQVARITKKPVGAVKALQRRGLAALRRELERSNARLGTEAT